VLRNILRVLSQNELREEHHLLTVHLVSEQVGPEDSRVTVRHVEGLVQSDVRVGTQVLVHQIVLPRRVVQMRPCVFISPVFSHQSLTI
jgi:hypothetical protein